MAQGSSDQDRSEKPTPHKLNKAKEKGQVARSQELSAILTALFFAVIWYGSSDLFLEAIGQLFKELIFLSSLAKNDQFLLELITRFSGRVGEIVFPVLVVAMLIGVVISVGQTGFIWSTVPLQPDFSKLNPIKGLKKLFSVKSLFELFKACIKFVVVGAVVYIFGPDWFVDTLDLRSVEPAELGKVLSRLVFTTTLAIGALLLVFALLDFSFTRWSHTRQLMMSKKEVKDEYKNREGDPDIRKKRKQKQSELLKKIMGLGKVKDADMVIVNPTHVAVALKYDLNSMLAPELICCGKGFLAAQIRKRANRYGVFVIRKPALARALYRDVQIGSAIGAKHYDQVAVIYRDMYKQRGSL